MRAALALLLTTALLAGCTGGTDDGSDSSSSSTGASSSATSGTATVGTTKATTTSGTSSSSGTTGNSTTKSATTTTGNSTSGGNSTTPASTTPNPVSQECAIGGGVYGNSPQSCDLPAFASSNGAPFTKGTVTFTYEGVALPEATLVLKDGTGAEIASGSGASPITFSIDGKVPAGSSVQLSGTASASAFAGFGGTLKVDLS